MMMLMNQSLQLTTLVYLPTFSLLFTKPFLNVNQVIKTFSENLYRQFVFVVSLE